MTVSEFRLVVLDDEIIALLSLGGIAALVIGFVLHSRGVRGLAGRRLFPVSRRARSGRFTDLEPAYAAGAASRRAPIGDRIRPGVSVLALVLSGLAVVAGCAAPGGDPSPLLPLARDLPADTNLRLPAAPPPNLIDAGLSSGNETPIISFYSLNEPIVSVCQATQEQCLSLLPTAQVIPRSDTGPDVTVLIEAGENGVVPLTDELERYWAEVELVAGRPAWLGVP